MSISRGGELKKLLIVQRVITPYRCELLEKMAPHFKSIEVLSSYGEGVGAAKVAQIESVENNFKVSFLRALRIGYKGESRSWSFFIYVQSVFKLLGVDVVLLEGTTNLANNIYIVPIAKLLGKKVVWWDAGYSPSKRTGRRKKIDFIVSILIRMTDVQIAYSTVAKDYMEKYMSAKNCHKVLNTISTSYFKDIKQEVIQSVMSHSLNVDDVRLLYVGAVEERKKVLELIKLVENLNSKGGAYSLTVVGDGAHLEDCKKFVAENNIGSIEFLGRIYNKDELKRHYFASDLFVMPGDGGLGVAQSLLFGLPVVCLAADGTERDYLDSENSILGSFEELESFLKSFADHYRREEVLCSIERLDDRNFISLMTGLLNK